MRHSYSSFALSVFGTLGLLGLAACSNDPASTDASTGAATWGPGSGYIDSAICAECHQAESDLWRGSHHDLAMQHATAVSVLGDFDDTSFEALGLTTRFFRKDGGFWVNTEGPDGALHDYEIAYTFGVEPLQQYLVEFPGGRLQCLTVAWDTDDGHWFTLYPDDRFPPDDALHWTGRYQNWNMMCADCHSTHLAKNYDAATDSYDTTWEELNVTCQACHGPGGEHVARARAHGADWRPGPDETGLVIALQREIAPPQLEACAPCHSRRRPLLDGAHVAGHFDDDYAIETLRAPLYFHDGQALEEVYVVGSFLQSKMHQKGVACSDCHNPHSLELLVPGNGVCTQCHSQGIVLPRFESLTRKNYDTAEHHHHAPQSEGAQCRNCHMPERTYMQIDERHDHSLRIPRPDISALIGTPNACNSCHDDQTPEWAAAVIVEWTGVEPPPHRGVIFAGAQTAHRAVASPLASIALDPGEPAIVRAAAMDLLSNYPIGGQVKLLALEDSEPLVRAAALVQLDDVPPDVLLERVTPLLADPVRRVRIAAARALAGAPGAALEAQGDASYVAAKAELFEAYDANADAPSASLNHGVYLSACGDNTAAVAAYRRAIELDSLFLPAIFNLANLLATIERTPEARELLAAAVESNPTEGELYYSLGLVLAELDEMEAAVDTLRDAARLLPGSARVHYNYGLAAGQLERFAEAEAGQRRAAELEPGNADFAYGLATFYLAQQRFDAALGWAVTLSEIVPEAPGPQQLIEEIERQRAAGD